MIIALIGVLFLILLVVMTFALSRPRPQDAFLAELERIETQVQDAHRQLDLLETQAVQAVADVVRATVSQASQRGLS